MSEDRAEPEPRKRVAFALARVDVERAGNLPPDAATAWLYERIRTGAVETWYTVFWPGDPNSKIRRNRHDRYGPLQQVTRHDEMSNVPRPKSLERYEVVAEDMERELAREFPPDANATVRNARNAGRRPDPKFEPAMVMVGAWLEAEGVQSESDVVGYLKECLALRDQSGDSKTLKEKAKIALGAFREWRVRN